MGEKDIGISTIVNTECELQDNGVWKVTQVITHKRSKDLKEWEEKVLEASSYSKDLSTALANVFISIQSYLEPRNNNLFEEPEVINRLPGGEYVS